MAGVPPVIAGVSVPIPNRYRRIPERVTATTELAGGGLVRYDRGARILHELEWSAMRDGDAGRLDDVLTSATVRRAFPFTEPLNGKVTAVLLEDYSGLDPIPGTSPMRHRITLTLVEVRTR